MAVAPASVADKIIVLDDEDDGEKSPQTSSAASRRSSQRKVQHVSLLKAQQPAPTHITQSPFASSKKEVHVVKVENERLFAEFVEHCSAQPQTQDCPEVITFLKTKHEKAAPSFLSSVEFRNVLGRCLTRAQANHSKTFVYINELCTVLRQHSAKKRQSLAEASKPSSSLQPQTGANAAEEPTTSGVNGEAEPGRRANRKSRKQIAYLENLLKVYNEEIRRLQETELSLDDLGAEDSLYIQEHKLKRKMMKLYEKLCEIKGCSTLTGRVLEQRIGYSGSRYPEINKKVEKFINSPEARANAPDYHDVLQVVLRANERHDLRLPRKQLNEIAKDAFRETATRIQERRHHDMVYNFGSHLTDSYRPASDPALGDPTLLRKLRSNRELALNRLEEVIGKYSSKQEDSEELERQRRSERDRPSKEGNASKAVHKPETNGVEEEEEEEEEDDDDEDDVSSDPDIEEELEASTQLDGTEGASDEDTNEAEQAVDEAQRPSSASASPGDEAEGSDLSPLSQQSKSLLTPLSTAVCSPPESPSQSAPGDEQRPLSNGTISDHQEEPSVPLQNQEELSVPLQNQEEPSVPLQNQEEPSVPLQNQEEPSGPLQKGKGSRDSVAENGVTSESAAVEQRNSSTSPVDMPRTTRSQKRKREEATPKHVISEADIPLDMGVCDSPPRKARAETPPYVSSSQATPPPKKNKVNVATQCDPQEVIVLSDSE